MSGSTAAWLLAGEPTPVRLMNTIWADKQGVHDDLTSTVALRDWLIVVGAIESSRAVVKVTSRELAMSRQLRDALRRLAAHLTGDVREAAESSIQSVADAIDAVNAAALKRSSQQLAVKKGQLAAVRAMETSIATAALADVAHDGIDLLTGPSAAQLRACQAPSCVLYFVKSHPRQEWCSPACGNRERAARHYRKTRAQRR